MASNRTGTTRTYGTRKQLLVPLCIDTGLAFILCAVVFCGEGTSLEKALVPVIFVVLAAVLWASFRRRVELGNDGIRIRRFIRTKDIPWSDITNVDLMVLKKKAYLLLTSTRGFHVISNTISDFSRIAGDIVENVSDEAVDPAVPAALSDAPRRMSDAVLLWIAAAVMIAILSYKLVH